MNEEIKQGEESSTENENDGVQQETISELDRADQIAERQTRENTRREAILDREEALAARKAVGGISEAGTESKPKFSEEELASRARIKAVADASNSSWGEKYA